MRSPPEREERRPDKTALPIPTATSSPPSIPDARDERRRARARLAGEHRRLAYARLAHQAMPLTAHYRHPKGGFYCTVTEGWRAA